MILRSVVLWILLNMAMNAYCSEWIYVTRNTTGDEFFVDKSSLEKNANVIFFHGLRNYFSPEKRFGSLSSVGKFEADCSKGGIRLHQFDYFAEKMGEGKIINSFPINDTEWFNPPHQTVGSKQLEFVCFRLHN